MTGRSLSRATGRRATLPLGRFMLVVLLTFAALCVLAVAAPQSDYIRWQNLQGTIFSRASWIYERLHFDPAPVDVVFLGSSRVGAAVLPTQLEPALRARGVNLRVANFSLPSSGFDIRETILNQVFADKAPKLIVYSVVEAFPRDGHDAFGDLGSVGEVLSSPWIVNRNLPGNLARLPVRQLQLALASAAPDAYGMVGTFDAAAYPGSTIDPRQLMGFDEDVAKLDTAEHLETLTRQAAKRRREITPPLLPASLSWIEFGISQTYVMRMLDAAEAHGAKVSFLFLPFFTGPEQPLERDWLEARAPLWRATFMREDPRSYTDSAHISSAPEIKSAMTEWLADRIVESLGDGG